MNKHLFAVLLSAVLITPAHAADADIGPGETATTTFESKALESIADFAGRNAQIKVDLAAGTKYSENVVLINQISGPGHDTYAYVNQSGGTGNLAVIMQDARVNSASAMIFQSGSGNRAVINQH